MDSFTLKMMTVISAKTSGSFPVFDIILNADSVQVPCNVLMVSVLLYGECNYLWFVKYSITEQM